MDFRALVYDHKDLIVNTRRDLHRIPEIGYCEEKTSRYITDFLKREGVPVQSGITKTGVMATLDTGKPGKTILIRSDIDALPITEDTGLPFASTHEGTMHACGHDAHMAMALGAAKIVDGFKDKLQGTIKFLFQPAEEVAGGAKRMIDAGVMENPKVDHCFGCHVWPGVPEGAIGVKAGPLMAAMDKFHIKIIGKGGHGAMPHLCVDALEVGTQVVNAFQRVVSRQMNPLSPTVITIGSFHAGTAFNIIAPEAELTGTTRTFDRTIWQQWPERLEKILGGVCGSMGATYALDFVQGCPPVMNDPEMADLVRRCAGAVVGKENIVEPEPTMGGEDMAFFLEAARGCFYFIGAGREGGAPIHNPKFTLNEDIMLFGVETYCRIIWEMLTRP
jgi:amidohydrolase